MKTVFLGVFILFLLLLNSCGFFKSIGLYNIPPDYAETFEEINGTPFIDHPNLKSNIVLELTPNQRVFSPYDSIKLKLRITNLSYLDTMYVYGLCSFGELIVIDSLSLKRNVLSTGEWVSQQAIVDDFGRIVNPTIAPYAYNKIEPNISCRREIRFQNGNSFFPQIYQMAFSLCKENIPGYYKAYYSKYHEEYDKIKGPIKTKIVSDTVGYFVRNLTEAELLIKNEAIQIVKIIDEKNNFELADSLLQNYLDKYPFSYYNQSLLELFVAKKEIESRNSNRLKK